MFTRIYTSLRDRYGAKQATNVEVGTIWWAEPAKPAPLLVPRHVIADRAAKQTRRRAIRFAAGSLVLTVFAVGGAFAYSQSAAGDRADAERDEAAVQTQLDELAPVADFYSGLDARRSGVAPATSSRLRYAAIVDAMAEAAPTGVTITALTTETGTTCEGPDPFGGVAALGCLTVKGTAGNAKSVATFVRALNADESGLLAGAFARSMANDAGESGFDLTVNFTAEAMAPPAETTDPSTEVDAETTETTDPMQETDQ